MALRHCATTAQRYYGTRALRHEGTPASKNNKKESKKKQRKTAKSEKSAVLPTSLMSFFSPEMDNSVVLDVENFKNLSWKIVLIFIEAIPLGSL